MYRLADVNSTDIRDAIRLGCQAMGNAFDPDDDDIPYGGASVRPVAKLGGSSEAHTPGRHLNALLHAEDAAAIDIDESVVEKHARAAMFSYSRAPLPLQRVLDSHGMGRGEPVELEDHNLREGFHALTALVQCRGSEKARALAEASIQAIFDYWIPDERWNLDALQSQFPITVTEHGYQTFIQRLARSIGPLVKLYKVTEHQPALALAIALKEKAVREFYTEEGDFSTAQFGAHAHSTTCVMSSLAQLADLTDDRALLRRVKSFYDNGLWQMRDQIGWSIEDTRTEDNCGRGEANNTGDIVETALILARRGDTEYYADAERILRSHLLPSQLRDVSFVVEPDNPNGVDGLCNVAERLRGGFGFPAQYGHEPAGIWDSKKPRIGFNLDIVGGAVDSLCAAYREVTRCDETGHWINMLFDHKSSDLEIRSPYSHSRLQVKLKRPGRLHLRHIPGLDPVPVGSAPSADAAIDNGYVILETLDVDRWIEFDCRLPIRDEVLTWKGNETRARFRGDEVIAMENFGTDLTFFEPLD
jgi:hypothetical protein